MDAEIVVARLLRVEYEGHLRSFPLPPFQRVVCREKAPHFPL